MLKSIAKNKASITNIINCVFPFSSSNMFAYFPQIHKKNIPIIAIVIHDSNLPFSSACIASLFNINFPTNNITDTPTIPSVILTNSAGTYLCHCSANVNL